ncbi:MAG: endonuclease III [Myxococcales bacterium]|nr:endonuclease III [Polyangiaceae bacterium]MDW8248225.1 endonuclease III [Myxococcales bacterium]
MKISPRRRARVAAAFARLRQLYPDARCELLHEGPFQLLVATVLSAQTTDRMVNQVTPALFHRFPDAESLARAAPEEVEPLLARLGFFRVKAKNIVALARQLVEHHQGKVPADFKALVALPGVGRKTANVVLGVCFGVPEGVVVDTHVQRLSQRLGWTRETTPDKIERELTALFPPEERDLVSHVLIFHGRRVCSAQRPVCDRCGVRDLCPSAGRAEHIGRKKKRA